MEKYEHCLYKSALFYHLKSEKINENLNMDDGVLLYNIGIILTHMDYANIANHYLKKAQIKMKEHQIIKFDLNVRWNLALNRGITGIPEESRKLLVSYLREVEQKKDNSETSGVIHHKIGLIYASEGNYDKALECFVIASQYFKKGSEAYIYNQCHTVLASFLSNKYSETLECIEEGLSMAIEGTLWHLQLTTIKHLMTLDKSESIEYMTKVAIPRLKEYGKNLLVIECYERLSSYHAKTTGYKTALKYKDLALKLNNQLMRGELQK